MMLRRIFYIFIFLIVLSCATSDLVFAQGNTDLGGKAICTFKGNVPYKKVVLDLNKLLLINNQGVISGSIQLQAISLVNNIVVDVNILALFGRVEDLEDFLAGKVHSFSSNNSDVLLKSIKKEDGLTTKVSNIFKDGSRATISGKIKVQARGNLAKGILKLTFDDSFLEVVSIDNEIIESSEDNNKINVKCRFNNVPIEESEINTN